MSDTSEDAVRAVIEQYVEACRKADVALLQSVFHPQAQMMGFLAGNLLTGGPEPFFEAVGANPPPPADGAAYTANITGVAVAGDVAQATLHEKNYMGLNFTDYFQLLKSDGSWKIVSKCFAHD